MSFFLLALVLLAAVLLTVRERTLAGALRRLAEAVEEGKPLLLERPPVGPQGRALGRLQRACNTLVANSRQASRAQRDYLKQVEATLGTIREAVFVVDPDNYIVMANESLRQFVGREQPLLGQRLEGLLRGADFLEYARAVKTGERRPPQEVSLRRGRDLHWFEVLGSRLPTEGEGGEALSLFVLHDVTNRKRLENLRSEFVANVSHELRTPVTIIKGYAETLVEDHHILSPEDRERFLRKIQKNVVRLHALLEDLLTISRLEAAVDPLDLARQSLGRLATEVVENFRGRMGPGQRLEVVATDGEYRVRGDSLRLTQVLDNLMENALRHARGFTCIRIRVTADEREVQCVVEDDGCGIPEEDLPHIFERFYRVDKGRSREHGGTGLGLSIVKHIVQAHGGRLLAESVPGEGTRIGFALPVVKGGEETPL